MADFDQFASAETTGQEEDPAAAFLAREQDQLATLEDDNFGVSEGQTSDAFAAQPTQDGDFFGSGVTAEPEGGAAGTGAQDLTFDPMAQVHEHEDIPQQVLEGEYQDNLGDEGAQHEADPYASVRMADTSRQEPEKIRIWREEQKEMLMKKDAESEEKKAEWREIARKELEDWYKHRDEQLEKTKASNREAEAAFVHDRDEKQPGHEWERICRLCEFNPKSSRNTKDIARMRSILLQLKQTPLQR